MEEHARLFLENPPIRETEDYEGKIHFFEELVLLVSTFFPNGEGLI